MKDAITKGFSPENEKTNNGLKISEDLEESTNSGHAGTILENITVEASDIKSTSKNSSKVSTKKPKKSKHKKKKKI